MLALFGGTPVRTRPFTSWPIFGKAEEERLLRAYLESLNVLKRRNAWFMDAEIVDSGSGSPQLNEEPIGGLPRVVTFGVRFRFR